MGGGYQINHWPVFRTTPSINSLAVFFEISNRTRIANTYLGWSGRFCPTMWPLLLAGRHARISGKFGVCSRDPQIHHPLSRRQPGVDPATIPKDTAPPPKTALSPLGACCYSTRGPNLGFGSAQAALTGRARGAFRDQGLRLRPHWSHSACRNTVKRANDWFREAALQRSSLL